MKRAVVLGAGITGLCAAQELLKRGFSVTVVEKTSKVGGMAATFAHGKYLLDYGPHKFYTQLPGIYDEFKSIVGEGNYIEVKKRNSLHLLDKDFQFPVRLTELLRGIPPLTAAKIMRDFSISQIARRKVKTYEDYFINGFGKTGYGILFEDYAYKVWDDPKKLSAELARRRVPVGSIFQLVQNIILKPKADVSADTFLYPRKGFGVIGEELAASIRTLGGTIMLDTSVEKIICRRGKARSVQISQQGKSIELACDAIISSIPISDIPSLIDAPKPVLDAAGKLEFRGLVIAYVFVNKKNVLKDNWVFYPERKFCFNRIAELKSFSPEVCPAGKTVLTAEITCSEGDATYTASDQAIAERILNDLQKAGVLKAADASEVLIKRAPRAYPVYHLEYRKHLNKVLTYLDSLGNIYSVGRLGLFNYNNVDHCIDMGKKTAEVVATQQDWKRMREYFDAYRIVD